MMKSSDSKRTRRSANFRLAIYSVLIAIFVWLVISMTFYPSVPKTITDIPLNIDSGTSVSDDGMTVISCDVSKVRIKILGSRTEVGNLGAEDFKAYIDTTNVTSAGKKTMSIKIDAPKGVEIQTITPSTVSVMFDKYDTREFPVQPKMSNVSFAEGKAAAPDEITCEPAVVNITGPSKQLDKIAACYAVSNKELTLDSSYTLQNDELQLYSEDGTLIDQSQLTFDNSIFSINIPVLTQKTVGLAVTIANAPEDFDQSCLKFTMSADSITIATRNSNSEIPDVLEIGKILLTDLDIGYTKTFDLSSVLESKDMINMSDLDTITVSLVDTDLIKREITITDFNISNAADKNYDYNVLTQSLTISVVGNADSVNELTASDFVADINLLNTDTSLSQFTHDVTISCPTHDDVWAITKSKVTVQKTEKATEEATTATADTHNQ